VVVDDGSTDGTPAWLESYTPRLPTTCIRQTNSGPARARNRGVEAAQGEVVLFLGDDTEPQPGWLATHLEHHRAPTGSTPVGVIGYTAFPSDSDTPFLRFINEYGAQFGYQLIDHPRDVPFNFFYTSNVSLPRQCLADNGGFREDFPAAAWEDIEFAYRATQGGLRLRYDPRARTLHHHRIRPETFCRRQRTSGRSASIFAGLHPELEDFLGVHRARSLTRWSALRQRVFGLWVRLGELRPGLTPLHAYRSYLDLAYLQGLAEGLQNHERRSTCGAEQPSS
jgi:GT2 family glycosyltransferase